MGTGCECDDGCTGPRCRHVAVTAPHEQRRSPRPLTLS